MKKLHMIDGTMGVGKTTELEWNRNVPGMLR